MKNTEQYLDEFYNYKMARSRRGSAGQLCNHLRIFFKWIKKPVHEITDMDIQAYALYLKVDRKFKINTQRFKRSSLRSFFGWYSTRYQKPNPARDLYPIPEEINIPIMPTPDEIARMVYECNFETEIGRRDAAILCLLADTGIRISECVALNVHHVRIHDKHYTLTVPGIKSRRERSVPFGRLVNDDLVAGYFSAYYLDIRVAQKYQLRDPLFKTMGPSHQGERFCIRNLYRVVKKYVRKAGLDDRISVHSFRHYFGTYSRKGKTKLEIINAHMGHARMDTTARYIHLAESVEFQRTTAGLKGPVYMNDFVKMIKQVKKYL